MGPPNYRPACVLRETPDGFLLQPRGIFSHGPADGRVPAVRGFGSFRLQQVEELFAVLAFLFLCPGVIVVVQHINRHINTFR